LPASLEEVCGLWFVVYGSFIPNSLEYSGTFGFLLWLYSVFACSLQLVAYSLRLSPFSPFTIHRKTYYPPDCYPFTAKLTYYKNLFSTELPNDCENWKLRYIFVHWHQYV
jgi:hypothetical protein